MVVKMFVLQLNTHTIGSPLTPPPFAVNDPVTETDDPLTDAAAVSEVETGLLSEPVLRFSVIVPEPVNVTVVGSFEPEHTNPPVQVQLENV